MEIYIEPFNWTLALSIIFGIIVFLVSLGTVLSIATKDFAFLVAGLVGSALVLLFGMGISTQIAREFRTEAVAVSFAEEGWTEVGPDPTREGVTVVRTEDDEYLRIILTEDRSREGWYEVILLDE